MYKIKPYVVTIKRFKYIYIFVFNIKSLLIDFIFVDITHPNTKPTLVSIARSFVFRCVDNICSLAYIRMLNVAVLIVIRLVYIAL